MNCALVLKFCILLFIEMRNKKRQSNSKVKCILLSVDHVCFLLLLLCPSPSLTFLSRSFCVPDAGLVAGQALWGGQLLFCLPIICLSLILLNLFLVYYIFYHTFNLLQKPEIIVVINLVYSFTPDEGIWSLFCCDLIFSISKHLSILILYPSFSIAICILYSVVCFIG